MFYVLSELVLSKPWFNQSNKKVSEFNGQFMDVFTKTEHNQVPLLALEDIVVTKEGVTKLLKGLNTSKALGSDELHPKSPKGIGDRVRPCICPSFPTIDKGEIPQEWSLASICPCSKRETLTGRLLATIVRFP